MNMLLSFFLIIFSISRSMEDVSRKERQINSIPLIYPYGGTYKLLLGFALPVPNKEKISLLFAANFQYQYLQFMNVSQLSKYYFIKQVARDERDVEERKNERLVFYEAASEMMTARGMNGSECMLRAICESAQFPVEDEGLFGEIIHVLLTPDYGTTAFDDVEPGFEEEMAVYRDAAVAGRQMFSCEYIYRGCPIGTGLLELISTLRNE